VTTIGRIIGGAPETSYYGSVVTAAAGIGDTVLHVDDVGDFDEDAPLNNGRLIVGALLDADGVLDVSGATLLPYLTCDDDAGTVTLADGLTEALEVGDVVYLYDPATEDAVADAIVYVEIEGQDLGGDALPAVVSYGVLGKIGDTDDDANGQVVTLEEDEDGQLTVTDVHGTDKPGREVHFDQDGVVVESSGAVVVQLTHRPMLNSEHVYWNGVYQPGIVWSRDGFVLTVPDDDGLFEIGDRVDVEYAWIDPERNDAIALPCDEWYDVDLSTATMFLNGDGNPYGIFEDGVIHGIEVEGTPQYPEFYFHRIRINPTKPLLIEATYDPDSPHDIGGRLIILSGFRPGHEQDDWNNGEAYGNLYDGWMGLTSDTQEILTGPGLVRWNDPDVGVPEGYTVLAVESDRVGALSRLRVKQICTTSTECLIPGDVYTNGTIHGTGVGGNLWAEDPATDTSGDTTGATLVDSGSTKNAHGWIPALSADPESVVGGVLKFYGAAHDTGDTGDPTKAYVAFQIGFTGGSPGSLAPFTDLEMTIELPNDPTLTPVYREFPLSTILDPTLPEVWARLTRTDPGHTGPRCLRFVTNGFETPDNDGTLTVDVWSARICLEYVEGGL